MNVDPFLLCVGTREVSGDSLPVCVDFEVISVDSPLPGMDIHYVALIIPTLVHFKFYKYIDISPSVQYPVWNKSKN